MSPTHDENSSVPSLKGTDTQPDVRLGQKADPDAKTVSDPKEVWKTGAGRTAITNDRRDPGSPVENHADLRDMGQGSRSSPYSLEAQADAVANQDTDNKR